jgi:hypothetical protein
MGAPGAAQAQRAMRRMPDSTKALSLLCQTWVTSPRFSVVGLPCNLEPLRTLSGRNVREVMRLVDTQYPSLPADDIDLVDAAWILCQPPERGQWLIEQLQQQRAVYAVMAHNHDRVVAMTLKGEPQRVCAAGDNVLQRLPIGKADTRTSPTRSRYCGRSKPRNCLMRRAPGRSRACPHLRGLAPSASASLLICNTEVLPSPSPHPLPASGLGRLHICRDILTR